LIYFTFEDLDMIRQDHLARLKYYPIGVDPSEVEVKRYTKELREQIQTLELYLFTG
jgi:hypothetical protein